MQNVADHRLGEEVARRRVLVRPGVEECDHISIRDLWCFDVLSEKIEIARLSHDLDPLHAGSVDTRCEEGSKVGVLHEQIRKKHLGGIELDPRTGNGSILPLHMTDAAEMNSRVGQQPSPRLYLKYQSGGIDPPGAQRFQQRAARA